MKRAVLAALAVFAIAGAARAEAPEPRRSLDLDRFMGRWYEILRTPNGNQRNCFAAYQDWSAQEQPARDAQHFHIRQHCHRGSPTGSDRVVNTSARVLNPPANTKFEASFFGGLIRGRYWVVDHAEDYSWMIATTEDGRFPALLARTPGLPAREQDRLKARMAEIGFDTGKLQAVGEP
jgi:apolipoprotein D and lipocalin family protein